MRMYKSSKITHRHVLVCSHIHNATNINTKKHGMEKQIYTFEYINTYRAMIDEINIDTKNYK